MTFLPGDRRTARKLARTSAAALALSAALTAGVAQAAAPPQAHRAQLPVSGLPTAGLPAKAIPGGPPGSAHPPASAKTTPVTAPTRPVTTILTDYQHGFGHWAYPRRIGAPIHSGPSGHFRSIGALHANTEDTLPEVYQVLAEQTGGRQGTWFKIAIPRRPNGETGWVPAASLGHIHLVSGMLVVSARSLRISYYKNGRLAFSAPVGDGTPNTPTPTGHFWIREKFPVPSGYPVYGPFAMGTSDYSNTLTDWPGGGVVGIHGTDEPQLIPGAPSHGCVRLRNGDITRLYQMISVGTPLLIK